MNMLHWYVLFVGGSWIVMWYIVYKTDLFNFDDQ
jgi:hypothetical protein